MKTPTSLDIRNLNLLKLQKTLNSLRFKLRYKMGYVPFLSRFVFMDEDAIFNKLRNDGMVKYVRNLRPAERGLLHFSFGMNIRNAFLLWHPKNPYTSLRLVGLSDEAQANSPYHPDNYSWAIIRRILVAADLGKPAE